jgi:hypothetical protein
MRLRDLTAVDGCNPKLRRLVNRFAIVKKPAAAGYFDERRSSIFDSGDFARWKDFYLIAWLEHTNLAERPWKWYNFFVSKDSFTSVRKRTDSSLFTFS